MIRNYGDASLCGNREWLGVRNHRTHLVYMATKRPVNARPEQLAVKQGFETQISQISRIKAQIRLICSVP
jgi:hypothetical protein